MRHIPWLRSFNGRLITVLLLLIILPLCISSYFFYSKSLKTINLSTDNFMRDILEQNLREFNQHWQSLNDIAIEIVGAREVQRFLSATDPSTPEELEMINDLVPYLLHFVNKYGIFEAKIIPLEPGDYPIYRTMILDETPEVSDAVKSAVNKNQVHWNGNEHNPANGDSVWVRYNMLRQFNVLEPKAILALSITNQSIVKKIQLPSRWERQQTLIVDNQGIVVTDSSNEHLQGQKLEEDLYRDIKSNQFGSQAATINNVLQKVTYGPLPIHDWYMISMIPMADLLKPVEVIRNFYFVLLAFVVALTVIVAYFMGRHLTTPIIHLVSYMKNFQLGQYAKLNTGKPRRDEFGYLMEGYSHMVKRINMLLEDIRLSEQRKKELHFTVLSNQINPHLVYNTLDAIKWKIRKFAGAEREETQEIINSLAGFMRLSLNQGKEVTTVAKELDHIKAYVQLEQLRQPDSFELICDVPYELLGKPMLKLILQPIVENALQHGKVQGKKTNIMISCRMNNGVLSFEVMDSGPGLPPELCDSPIDQLIEKQKLGVGLSNVHERIRLKYGASYGIRLSGADGRGAVVHIVFPSEETS
ncbi:sensor histidine kinase [Paenibacillus eucommiae]|uniref:histidine kinase n=1 Tax=Paenibacillus eucommiae TaxID=1355755 RepID=A0ABS4J7C0_9BACL|nr:histidine kinase [Paenibacillus eucommiae]MBP1995742.1 sensor histidine kinase YesM [Paenibacillus eucommiae]